MGPNAAPPARFLESARCQQRLRAACAREANWAQAHEDKFDSLRAQLEDMKTMLKALQGYTQRRSGGHVQTSPDRVQNGVRRVLCTEHF